MTSRYTRNSHPLSYIDRKVYYKRQDIIRFMENNIHRITP